jgi:hypothetical protein
VRQRGLTRQGRLLSERYRQVVRRRSDAKAIVRSGHQNLLAAYRVLVPAQPYKDPGSTTLGRLTLNDSPTKPSDAYKTPLTRFTSRRAPTQHNHETQHHVRQFSQQGPESGLLH